MDQTSLVSALADLALPAVRYYDTIDSTNDEAWRWVTEAAPNLALVVADEQTAGKGRLHRRWITRAGTGLAFSLVLHSPPLEAPLLACLTGLGALAPCVALQRNYALKAQIKWPNDILLEQHKAGGVLVETRWQGENLLAAVVGIGINILPGSLDPQVLPADMLNFPATSIEIALGRPIDRMEFLHTILQEFLGWLPRLGSPGFVQAWEDNLAYRNQWVELLAGNASQISQEGISQPPATRGKVIGLTQNGALILQTSTGKSITVQVGEMHLQPIIASPTD